MINKPKDLTLALINIAHQAGQAIMSIYHNDPEVQFKSDASPVTLADRRAEEIIVTALGHAAPGIPVIAEEAAAAGHLPDIENRFFLVDPLDGTREFLKKNGEFTVNIALIENNIATCGVVYAPALSKLFWATDRSNAYQAKLTLEDNPGDAQPGSTKLTLGAQPKDGLRMITSRSHSDDASRALIADVTIAETLLSGSSIKFCMIAAGHADIYPRAGRTMEWDTAAGHAVLQAAGGSVVTTDQAELTYGKTHKGFANPAFIARGWR